METTLTLWKPVESRRAQRQGQKRLVLGIVLSRGVRGALALLLMGCGGGNSTPVTPPIPAVQALQVVDVQNIVQAAVNSGNVDMAVAVVDRAGFVLGVFRTQNAPAAAVGNFGQVQDANDVAVALARTGAFFSNDQAPLSSRTVRFISGIHFPPGIDNTANAALYGIENTNRGCPLNVTFLPGQQIGPSRSINGSQLGLGIVTGKVDVFDSDPNSVNGGGVPLFKNGHIVGGVGVAGSTYDVDEFAAFSGAIGAGFGPTPAPPGVVIIDGIALPFVNTTTRPASVGPGSFSGTFSIGPMPSPGPVPEGDLIQETAGTAGLTLADVQQLVQNAIATANTTRAVIRLPLGQRAKFAIAVADLDGRLLAFYRNPDSTILSLDFAAAKPRNDIYFSSAAINPIDLPGVPLGTPVTNRTISFGAQPLFPPGINAINPSTPGPFFNLFQFDVANPCTNGHQPANPNQSAIVFFHGSVPRYQHGVLDGGFGVSGDGVGHEDRDTAVPPVALRA